MNTCIGVKIGNDTFFVDEDRIKEAGSKEEAAKRLKAELFPEKDVEKTGKEKPVKDK